MKKQAEKHFKSVLHFCGIYACKYLNTQFFLTFRYLPSPSNHDMWPTTSCFTVMVSFPYYINIQQYLFSQTAEAISSRVHKNLSPYTNHEKSATSFVRQNTPCNPYFVFGNLFLFHSTEKPQIRELVFYVAS